MATERLYSGLLTAILLPFFVAGILVAVRVAMWVTDTSWQDRSLAFLGVAVCLVPIGIFVAALIAYGLIVFFATWRSPSHPWATYTIMEHGLGRFFNRPFRAVHTFSSWLAPKRS